MKHMTIWQRLNTALAVLVLLLMAGGGLALWIEYARAAAHFDPQELRRRRESSEKTFTTREVLEHLDSLGAP